MRRDERFVRAYEDCVNCSSEWERDEQFVRWNEEWTNCRVKEGWKIWLMEWLICISDYWLSKFCNPNVIRSGNVCHIHKVKPKHQFHSSLFHPYVKSITLSNKEHYFDNRVAVTYTRQKAWRRHGIFYLVFVANETKYRSPGRDAQKRHLKRAFYLHRQLWKHDIHTPIQCDWGDQIATLGCQSLQFFLQCSIKSMDRRAECSMEYVFLWNKLKCSASSALYITYRSLLNLCVNIWVEKWLWHAGWTWPIIPVWVSRWVYNIEVGLYMYVVAREVEHLLAAYERLYIMMCQTNNTVKYFRQ